MNERLDILVCPKCGSPWKLDGVEAVGLDPVAGRYPQPSCFCSEGMPDFVGSREVATHSPPLPVTLWEYNEGRGK